MNTDRWAPWRFLLGEWVGTGGGAPGESDRGGSTFALELDDHVLSRRSYAHYAATADRAEFTHDDLLFVHPDGDAYRAVYFDSEGHVIHYAASADGASAVFESDADANGMRYRLGYRADGARMTVTFDIAPPGRDFTTYVTGTLERAA